MGGDEIAGLHRLLAAIDAGDRAGSLDGLETLLLALGREEAAGVVREAATRELIA